MTDVIIFHFGPFFAPFFSRNNPKNQNFEKIKKKPGDIIILHMCTKNYDQMIYGSWEILRDRCNCNFSFWAIFCPFTPLSDIIIYTLKRYHHFTPPRDLIITPLEISSFYISVPNIMTRKIMLHDRQTDGWTDGRMEKVTYRGGCPS